MLGCLFANSLFFFRSNEEEKYFYTGRIEAGKKEVDRPFYLGIYGGLVVALVILGITRALLFFRVILQSSKNIHGEMFRSVLKAPMYFFDTNSIGKSIFVSLDFGYCFI